MLSTEGGLEAVADVVGRSGVAVMVPCYNEETAIGKVVNDFRAALPEAHVYVYDENSRDRTIEVAAKAGTITRHEVRQEGSSSKLSTWRDGYRILRTIMRLYRSERPLVSFSSIGILLAAMSIGIAMPLFFTYLETGLVPRFPTAILAIGLMVLAVLSVFGGLIFDTVPRGRRELKLLAYLAQPAPGEERRES